MTKCDWSEQCGWSESCRGSNQMVHWCRVGLVSVLLWSVMVSAVAAQGLAAPDLERAAAEEVRQREALGSLKRDGTAPTSDRRPPTVIVHEERHPERQQERGLNAVARSVNGELIDVARAFRRLDQSYAIRGFQGCAAATAGSVFVDWRAKGVRPEDRVAVLPPEPIVLGRPKAALCSPPCSSCGRPHLGENGYGCQPTTIYARPFHPAESTLTPQIDRPCCNGTASPTPLLRPTPSPLNEALPAPAP